MVEFVAGLVLGAVLGVIADRLWERVEKRPRVEVQPGFFADVKGNRSLYFQVTNVGRDDLPPHQVCLYSPARGKLFMFERERDGPLQPGQHVRHHVPLTGADAAKETVGSWYGEHDPAVTDEQELSRCAFRLEVENSARCLYENYTIGTALVRALRTAEPSADGPHFDTMAMRDVTWRTKFNIWRTIRRLKRDAGSQAAAAPGPKATRVYEAGVQIRRTGRRKDSGESQIRWK